MELEVPHPDLWSPATPALYDLRLELQNPEGVLDTVGSYFGFRSISTKNGKVFLNGEPIYLKTVLDQGYWPHSNLTAPDDEAIQFDLRITKELGFNGVRKHQKVEDPRYLHWADRLGVLVSAEMANAYLFNSDAVARLTHEWIEVVNRDYNHPCVVIWVPVNESWGIPNIADSRQQAHLKALYYLTKSLDETRLVVDNDGWEHTEVTDLFAIHDYTATGEELLIRYAIEGVPVTLKDDLDKLYLAPGHTYNGAPLFLSEFGWRRIRAARRPRKGTSRLVGLLRSGSDSNEDALDRIGSLSGAIGRIPRDHGGFVTPRLYDVEQEVNGSADLRGSPLEVRSSGHSRPQLASEITASD